MFLYLSILIFLNSRWSSGHLLFLPDSHYYVDLSFTQTVSPQYISNQSSSHPCSWSSTDIFDALFLTLSEGSTGRACGTVFIKCAVGYTVVIGLLNSPLMLWLTQTNSSPACSIHATHSCMCSIQVYHFFNLLYHILIVPSLFLNILDMQILTLMLQLPEYSVQ